MHFNALHVVQGFLFELRAAKMCLLIPLTMSYQKKDVIPEEGLTGKHTNPSFVMTPTIQYNL